MPVSWSLTAQSSHMLAHLPDDKNAGEHTPRQMEGGTATTRCRGKETGYLSALPGAHVEAELRAVLIRWLLNWVLFLPASREKAVTRQIPIEF